MSTNSTEQAVAARMRAAWTLLSNGNDAATLASVFVRNAIPVAGVIGFGWSGSKFLLLAVFNSALSLALSGVSPATASTLIETQRAGKPVSRIRVGVQAVAIAAALSALLTAMLGWPIVVQSTKPVFDRGLWLAVAITLIALLPAVIADVRALAKSSGEQLKGIAQRRSALAIFSIVPIGMTWTMVGDSHAVGTIIAVVIVTAFSIVRDLRPDLAADLGTHERPSTSDSSDGFAALDGDSVARAEQRHARKNGADPP